MSDSGAPEAKTRFRFSRRSATCILWHAACLFVLTSCLTGPVTLIDTNAPPLILPETIAPDGSTLLLEKETDNRIWVIVQDDQEEPPSFIWSIGTLESISNGEPMSGGENGIHGEQISLDQDLAYDGQVLECAIYDNGGNSASISWLLEVPE